MTLRYLFGPVTAAFAADHLAGPRQRGECLAFGRPGADLTIGLDETWDEICRRFPPDWRPDFVALNLAYTSIPDALWDAPLPRVGLAANANLLWHTYRFLLPNCDLVLTDAPSAERLHRAGLTQALPANLYGLGRSFLGLSETAGSRDQDVVFVGKFYPAVQRERLP